MSALQYFSNLAIQLSLKHSFWGWLLQQIDRHPSNQTNDIALAKDVYGGVVLLVNEHLHLNKKDEQLLLRSIQHECLHYIFHHYTLKSLYRNTLIFDLAADSCVEQYLEELELSFIFPLWRQLGLEPYQSIHYYYDQIEVWYNESEANKKVIENLGRKNKVQLRKHRHWDKEGQEEEELGIWIETAFYNPNLDIPHAIKLAIENQLNIPNQAINWKLQLSRLVRNSFNAQIYASRKKVSKRYGSAPGNKIRKRYKILIAIDTSGSVEADLLALFFSEIASLYRQGVDIDIIECDTQIRNQYTYYGHSPTEILGRGGTDYNPAIQFYNENRQYGGLVYFTDGLGTQAIEKTSRPLLWIICHDIIRYEWHAWPGQFALMQTHRQVSFK